MAQGTLPQPMTLPALQAYVAEVVRERGFTTERNEVMILLMEEVGELARELTRAPAREAGAETQAAQAGEVPPKGLHKCESRAQESGNLAFELADIVLYLLDLANSFRADLGALWPTHEARTDQRFAHRRHGEPTTAHFRAKMSLGQVQSHVETKRRERRFEEGPERLALLLTEEVGEIATEVRKGWKNMADPERAGMEVIDALCYTLRLAWCEGVDIEAAITQKEQQNAGRVWQY